MRDEASAGALTEADSERDEAEAAVRIVFTKISDERHAVAVTRADGSSERVELDTRSFLRHDLAHFAIESEVPIRRGYWGSVAAGASLRGDGVVGNDAQLAESLAGPLQTLFRIEAGRDAYAALLEETAAATGQHDLAERVYERIRRLRGEWKATPYGGAMTLDWPESVPADQRTDADTPPARRGRQ